MNKICKFLTLIILIVAVLLFGIYQYRTFIQTEIYQENSEHLLATYEQVNRTFTLFTQRNWNVLSDWDEYLQCISDAENTETVWHDFADRKNMLFCITGTKYADSEDAVSGRCCNSNRRWFDVIRWRYSGTLYAAK